MQWKIKAQESVTIELTEAVASWLLLNNGAGKQSVQLLC